MLWKPNLCWVEHKRNQLPHTGGWPGQAWEVVDSAIHNVSKDLDYYCLIHYPQDLLHSKAPCPYWWRRAMWSAVTCSITLHLCLKGEESYLPVVLSKTTKACVLQPASLCAPQWPTLNHSLVKGNVFSGLIIWREVEFIYYPPQSFVLSSSITTFWMNENKFICDPR